MIYSKDFSAIISRRPHTFCEVYNLIAHRVRWHNGIARAVDDGWSTDFTQAGSFACDNAQAGVNTVLRFLITDLESSLCLSSCWWFSQDQNCTLLSSAWPSVAMATLSSWDWWRVRKAWHSLSQKNYLFTLLSCLYPYRCRTFYNMRDLVTLLRTCWQLNMKLAVTVQFHWLCWINGEMHSIHTFRTDSLRCPT